MSNPWIDETIARQQRAVIDEQLQAKPWPAHFTALVSALKATSCPGAILDVGCGVGGTREIMDRAGLEYRSFTGIDISTPAIAIAKERYPESRWLVAPEEFERGAAYDPSVKSDVVVDSSCLLHVSDWADHVNRLCAASRRWVILHRVAAFGTVTEERFTEGYGKKFPAWCFALGDLDAEMRKHGFVRTEKFTADGGDTLVYAKPRHYVAYADNAFLPRLQALHESMKRHCAPYHLHVLAWGDGMWSGLATAPAGSTVSMVHVSGFLARHPDLALDKLPGPLRTRIEHMWTVGPQWIADCMEKTGEPVTYVDADVAFFSSPESVFAEIGDAPAGVVPHGFAPASAELPGPTFESHDVFGRYNVGIVHFASIDMVTLWAERCKRWCYDRLERVEEGWTTLWNVYGDQKYLEELVGGAMIERVPRPHAYVIRHPGAAPGPWCINTLALDVRDGVVHFGGRPLVAFHFSALKFKEDGTLAQLTRPEYQMTKRQAEILWRPYLESIGEHAKGSAT